MAQRQCHLAHRILGAIQRGVQWISSQPQFRPGRCLGAPQRGRHRVEHASPREVELPHDEAAHLPRPLLVFHLSQTLKGSAGGHGHEVAGRTHQHQGVEVARAAAQLRVLHALAAQKRFIQQPAQGPAGSEIALGHAGAEELAQQHSRLLPGQRGAFWVARGFLHSTRIL